MTHWEVPGTVAVRRHLRRASAPNVGAVRWRGQARHLLVPCRHGHVGQTSVGCVQPLVVDTQVRRESEVRAASLDRAVPVRRRAVRLVNAEVVADSTSSSPGAAHHRRVLSQARYSHSLVEWMQVRCRRRLEPDVRLIRVSASVQQAAVLHHEYGLPAHVQWWVVVAQDLLTACQQAAG